jgi:hypothetical protein
MRVLVTCAGRSRMRATTAIIHGQSISGFVDGPCAAPSSKSTRSPHPLGREWCGAGASS